MKRAKKTTITEAQQTAVQNYAASMIGMAAGAMLVAGVDVLKDEFGFTEEQAIRWYGLTRAKMLDNAETMGSMARLGE